MGEFFATITSNHIINVAAASWCVAQFLKIVIDYALTRNFSAKRIVGAGGMPSSHTAFVVSMLIATYQVEGFESSSFAVAFALAAVVIYDALGVRRTSGEQSKAINDIVVYWLDHIPVGGDLKPRIKKLNELLGHTPMEVAGGAIVGITVAMLM